MGFEGAKQVYPLRARRRRRPEWRSLAAALALAPYAACANPALSPSQVTAPSYRPAPAVGGGIVVPEGVGPEAPSGSANLFLRVGRLEIRGAFPELSAADEIAAKAVDGQRVSVAALFAVAAALERAYAQAGYLLARVTVPAQRLVDGGPVRLQVIDGFIEAVDLESVPERVRAVVAGRLNALIGRRGLRLAEIERALLLAGDAPGLALQSALARGSEPGGVRLVVEAKQTYGSGSVTSDNRLPASLGPWQTNATLSLNDIWGMGEQFYVSTATSLPVEGDAPQDARLALISLGASAPLGVDGLSLSPEYTHSTTRPRPSPGAPAIFGVLDRFVAHADYDVLRDRAHTVTAEGSLGYVAQRNEAIGFGADLDRDAYGFARGGLSWSTLTPWGAQAHAQAELSQGLGGRDAKTAAKSGVPLSRIGASPYFHKLGFDGSLSEALSQDLRLLVETKGQWTFGAPVFVSEQFALDGADAVSAFPNGALSVDSGATLRAELGRPFAIGLSAWSPYLFAAGGAGRLLQPTAVEIATLCAGAVGAGLRVQFAWAGAGIVSAGGEAAREESNAAQMSRGYRINLNFGLQF